MKADSCITCPLTFIKTMIDKKEVVMRRDCNIEMCDVMTTEYTDTDVYLFKQMHHDVCDIAGQPGKEAVNRWKEKFGDPDF